MKKNIIKISSAAIMRVVTELATRPRFSKAISLAYIMLLFSYSLKQNSGNKACVI